MTVGELPKRWGVVPVWKYLYGRLRLRVHLRLNICQPTCDTGTQLAPPPPHPQSPVHALTWGGVAEGETHG